MADEGNQNNGVPLAVDDTVPDSSNTTQVNTPSVVSMPVVKPQDVPVVNSDSLSVPVTVQPTIMPAPVTGGTQPVSSSADPVAVVTTETDNVNQPPVSPKADLQTDVSEEMAQPVATNSLDDSKGSVALAPENPLVVESELSSIESSPTTVPSTSQDAKSQSVSVPVVVGSSVKETAAVDPTPGGEDYNGPHDITDKISLETPTSEPNAEKLPAQSPNQAPSTVSISDGSKTPAESVTTTPVSSKQEEMTKGVSPAAKDDSSHPTSRSTVGISGVVLGAIGIVLFFIMLFFPYYSSHLSSSWTFLGWLSTVGFLILGFVLSLFHKGNVVFKCVLFTLLVISLVMYYGVNVSSSGSFLGSLLSSYR